MKTLKLFTLAVLATGISSCAFHQGMMNDSASLHGQDFELIGMAVGNAQTTHVLGIGGLDPTGLVLDAKRSMYNRFPLRKGQAYANLSVDFKRSFFFIVQTTQATVSADIVQFGELETDSLQKLFQNNLELAYTTNLDDSEVLGIMLNGKLIRVSILRKSNNGHLTLIDQNGKIYENMKQYLLFQMKKGYTTDEIDFSVRDQVGFKIDESTLVRGMVIGISGSTIAIKAQEKTYQIFAQDIFEVIK
ncbi:hypothetical protein O3Q51_01940 [Cryomorphaceae bacterium 1068]|nr:hypothetical protein [Cryomorphaceae bacterium 1068]